MTVTIFLKILGIVIPPIITGVFSIKNGKKLFFTIVAIIIATFISTMAVIYVFPDSSSSDTTTVVSNDNSDSNEDTTTDSNKYSNTEDNYSSTEDLDDDQEEVTTDDSDNTKTNLITTIDDYMGNKEYTMIQLNKTIEVDGVGKIVIEDVELNRPITFKGEEKNALTEYEFDSYCLIHFTNESQTTYKIGDDLTAPRDGVKQIANFSLVFLIDDDSSSPYVYSAFRNGKYIDGTVYNKKSTMYNYSIEMMEDAEVCYEFAPGLNKTIPVANYLANNAKVYMIMEVNREYFVLEV